jgi:hypothetical protein
MSNPEKRNAPGQSEGREAGELVRILKNLDRINNLLISVTIIYFIAALLLLALSILTVEVFA